MCPNKEWFSSFKELHGEVLMGNNNACKTIRIGMIWLKTHVGEKALQNLGKQGLLNNAKTCKRMILWALCFPWEQSPPC